MSINRHRITTDGDGITTLVTFYGCPLRCKYCLNPVCFAPDTPRTDLTPDELYRMVMIDDLYFIASGGGVTFGGGEPLLNADFLQGFTIPSERTVNNGGFAPRPRSQFRGKTSGQPRAFSICFLSTARTQIPRFIGNIPAKAILLCLKTLPGLSMKCARQGRTRRNILS